MDRLVTCLQELENSDLPDVPQHEDVYLYRCDNELVREIQDLATTLFVSDDGNPMFEEIDKLWQTYGYFIFPGERDRFGWLTACIQTRKGIIVFG